MSTIYSGHQRLLAAGRSASLLRGVSKCALNVSACAMHSARPFDPADVFPVQTCSPWPTRSPSTGAPLFTTSSTTAWERRSRRPPPACSSTASRTPPTTATGFASACCLTSTATPPSRTPGGTSAKVQYGVNDCAALGQLALSITYYQTMVFTDFKAKATRKSPLLQVIDVCFSPAPSQVSICTMLAGRCTQSVWVTAVSSSRAVTVTTTTASIPRPCARFPAAAAWRFSTTKSSPSCWRSPWTTALRLSMSSPRCAPSAWVSLR